MKLDRKLDLAKKAVESITRHDDESLEQRAGVVRALVEYAAAEMEAAEQRAAVALAAKKVTQ